MVAGVGRGGVRCAKCDVLCVFGQHLSSRLPGAQPDEAHLHRRPHGRDARQALLAQAGRGTGVAGLRRHLHAARRDVGCRHP
eukprot:9113614-Pyramimonas_sp.AAC.1